MKPSTISQVPITMQNALKTRIMKRAQINKKKKICKMIAFLPFSRFSVLSFTWSIKLLQLYLLAEVLW